MQAFFCVCRQPVEYAKRAKEKTTCYARVDGPEVIHKGWSVLCTNRHETGNCDQKSCVLSDDFFDGLYQRVVRIDDNLQWQLQEHDK